MPVTKTFDSLRLLFSECVGHILNFFIKKEGGLEIINFKTLEDDSEKRENITILEIQQQWLRLIMESFYS